MKPEADSRCDGLRLTDERPGAPFAAVEVRLTDGGGVAMAGLGTPAGESLLATYDLSARRAAVELRLSDSTRVLAVTSGGPRSVRGLAFGLCENQATALVDAGDGWQPLLTTRRNVAAFADFRDPGVLRRYTYAYGIRPAAPATDRPATLTSVRAGVFGMAGVRDPHLVQLPDGTPYVRDGKLYLTLTCAGLGFFQQAHWGVFALDLDEPWRLEQVAHLFFRRDGRVLGDHAGQLIVDGDRFLVTVSSWGDFAPGNIHVRHTVSDRDLLSGIHILDTERLALPTEVGAWDPAVTRIEDRWHVAFVESPSQGTRFDFHPALAVGAPGAGYDGRLELAGADTGRRQCEGPILARLEPAVVSTGPSTGLAGSTTDSDVGWRVLASDGEAREYPVYDLSMRQVGALDAPYGTNIPHPQVVSVPGPRGPRLLLVTFDGTQYAESVLGYGGHGDLVILEAAPTT